MRLQIQVPSEENVIADDSWPLLRMPCLLDLTKEPQLLALQAIALIKSPAES